MNEFTHRIATFDDIPAIEKLMKQSINQLLGPLLTKDQLEASFSDLFASIRLVRNLRAVSGLKPSQTVPVRFELK